VDLESKAEWRLRESNGKDVTVNSLSILQVVVTMCWRLCAMRRCFLANLRSFGIRESHELHTQRNRRSDLTGSLHKIVSAMVSNGI
jgi:hypothetical protein